MNRSGPSPLLTEIEKEETFIRALNQVAVTHVSIAVAAILNEKIFIYIHIDVKCAY
jgi:hypothetical protein